MKHKAWRIYHDDPFGKVELTQSPNRAKRAREVGRRVVRLIEIDDIRDMLKRNGLVIVKKDGEFRIEPYFEMMGT